MDPIDTGSTASPLPTPSVPTQVLERTLPRARRPLIGRTLAGRYTLTEALGEGGMATVYRANDSVLGRDVAVKVRLDDVAANLRSSERFDLEIRNTARLRHPHNVRVINFGQAPDGLSFMVMELVEGVPLTEIPGAISERRALRLISQLSGAVGEAHNHGMVHRDLKPANILVEQIDGYDFAHVLDYGIAKTHSEPGNLTLAGCIIGTPAYFSPEQSMGRDADARSDVYALGLLLYELLTGRPPFDADHPLSLLRMHREETPPPPSEYAAVSPLAEGIVLRCLAKDPAERPANGEALRKEIESALNGVEITSRPATQTPSHWVHPLLRQTTVVTPMRRPRQPRARLSAQANRGLRWIGTMAYTALIIGLSLGLVT